MPDPIQLVPGKTDQEIYDDLKKRVVDAYQPLLALCDEAQTHGFIIQVGIGPNAFGKFAIQNCQIMKVFK